MRKIQKGIFFFVTFAFLTFSSCSNSDDTVKNSNSPTGKLPVTNNANVTPLSTPTPLQTPLSASPTPSPATSASPIPAISPTPTPKTGDNSLNVKTGKSKAIISFIDNENGIIELDHDDIPGMMPAMIMEFYVKDKSMLKGFKVGDKVSFVLEERNGVERIIELKKL